jgi:hypothetical protein
MLADIVWIRHRDRSIGVVRGCRDSCGIDADCDRFTAKEDRTAITPAYRCLDALHSLPLFGDPVDVASEKRRRLGTGSAARDGDAQCAVWPHPKNVPTRSTHADELDATFRSGRCWRRLVRVKWKLKLHAG